MAKKDLFDLDLTVESIVAPESGNTTNYTAYPWPASVNCSYAPANDEVGPEAQVC